MTHDNQQSAVPDPPAANSRSLTDRLLSSFGSRSRMNRWVEFLSAALLALATIATTWSAYESTLFNGDVATARAAANAATVKSAQYIGDTVQTRSLDAILFVECATAVSQNDQKLKNFLYQRFPRALKTAADAWIATGPLTNPDAPASPFVMPEYVLEQNEMAAQWQAIADNEIARAVEADEISERYVLMTVLFASVLFFSGIAGKFKSQAVDLAMLVIGSVVFITGLGILLTFPSQ